MSEVELENWAVMSAIFSLQLPTSMVQAASSRIGRGTASFKMCQNVSNDYMDPQKERNFMVPVVEVGGRLKLINDGLRLPAFQAHCKCKLFLHVLARSCSLFAL